MKLAVLTMRLFDQPRSGGELCTARLLLGLAQAGHDITVIGRGQGPAQRRAGLRWLSVGDVVPAFDDMPLSRRLGTPLAALAAGRPVTTQRLHGVGSARLVQRHLAGLADGLDGLVIDHLHSLDWVLPMLAELPPPMVVMHNLESDGYTERALNLAGHTLVHRSSRWFLRREAQLLRQLEFHALMQASVIACLSEPDAQRFRELAAVCGAQAAVQVLPGYALPPGAGLGAVQPPDGSAPTEGAGLSDAAVAQALRAIPPGARRIGMVGTWTWAPNRVGLQWMLDAVHRHLPAHCHLVLAGTGLEGLSLPPRTVALGRITDVHSLYRQVDVVAIPSVCGSGVHEKAIEAIGSGLTTVATPHALRGLLQQLPANVHMADSPQAFAQACAQVPAVAAAAAQGQRWAARRAHDYREALQRCLDLAAARQPA